jgi:hypothetical protein
MTLLLAENEALSTRQRALQKAIDHNTLSIEALQQEQRQLDPAAGGGQAQGRADAASGPAAGPGGRSPMAAAAAAVSATGTPDARAARVRDFRARYISYVTDIRATRLLPDGSVRPLPEGDPRLQEFQSLIDTIMTLPADDQYLLLTTNMETGEQAPHDPGMHSAVARQMQLRWGGGARRT